MKAYYNEFDKNAAAWLRELISDGLIAPGDVDERSIIDVEAKDLAGYTQHHFFAGIGGWSYALRLAQWTDNKPVWTASLPCQPFSTAGKQLGKQDERHLLPHFLELVKQCKPNTIFGEQVEGAIRHGWLDDLQATMEAENYAVGHVVLGAHSIGSAHIRQRLYWVVNSVSNHNRDQIGRSERSKEGSEISDRKNVFSPWESSGTSANVCGLGNAAQQRFGEAREDRARPEEWFTGAGYGMADSVSDKREQQPDEQSPSIFGTSIQSEKFLSGFSDIRPASNIEWIYCRDNKYRPIESGLKPLVDGVPRGMVHSSDPRNTQEARVMRLKGYGNAIVPQVAAEFIRAFSEVIL